MALVNILPQDAKSGDIFTGTFVQEDRAIEVKGKLYRSEYNDRLLVSPSLPYTHDDFGNLTTPWTNVTVQRDEPSLVEQFAKLKIGDSFKFKESGNTELRRIKISEGRFITIGINVGDDLRVWNIRDMDHRAGIVKL